MRKMSKETASTLMGMQSRLTEAEVILKLVLDDNIDRDFITALTTTYFSYLRNTGDKDEKTI